MKLKMEKRGMDFFRGEQDKCSSCPYVVHDSAACDCPFTACVLTEGGTTNG